MIRDHHEHRTSKALGARWIQATDSADVRPKHVRSYQILSLSSRARVLCGWNVNRLTKQNMNKAITASLALLFACIGSARAVLTLTLASGTTVITVVDQGPNDANGTVGLVVFSGSIGSFPVNFPVNIVRGISKPVYNGVTEIMWLDHIFYGSGTVTATLSDNGFASSGGLIDETMGKVNGTFTSQFFVGQAMVASQGPFTNSEYNVSSIINNVELLPTDQLSLVITVTHSGNQASSGTKEIKAPRPLLSMIQSNNLVVIS